MIFFKFHGAAKWGIVTHFLDNYFVSNILTMATKENLSSLQCGIQSSCLLESVILPSTPPKQLFDLIHHFSLQSIWALSSEAISSTPGHQLLSFSFKKGINLKEIKTFTPMELKRWLTASVNSTTIPQIYDQMTPVSKMGMEVNAQKLASVLKMQIFNKILKATFLNIIKEVLEKITGLAHASIQGNYLLFNWKMRQIEQIYDYNKSLVDNCKSLEDIQNLIRKQDATINQPEDTSRSAEFMKLLGQLSGNIDIKVQLYKRFQTLVEENRLKDNQLNAFLAKFQQSQSIISKQMGLLATQEEEFKIRQAELCQLKIELESRDQRYDRIEDELTLIKSEFQSLKLPIIQKQKAAQNYYINPLYEKNMYEEKLMMEMIQVQSQLLVYKQQIKIMTESILDVIKISLKYLQHLPSTKLSKLKYSRSVSNALKDVKSLQHIDLQTILDLKEDSSSYYESEGFSEMRKSQLSTFSQIEGDQKSSRIFTEDDSLSFINTEQ